MLTHIPDYKKFKINKKEFVTEEIINPIIYFDSAHFNCPMIIFLTNIKTKESIPVLNHDFFHFITKYINDEKELDKILIDLNQPKVTIVPTKDDFDGETLSFIESLRNGAFNATNIPGGMFVSTSFDFIVNEETFVYFKLLDTLN
jgi:hypothetical protein